MWNIWSDNHKCIGEEYFGWCIARAEFSWTYLAARGCLWWSFGCERVCAVSYSQVRLGRSFFSFFSQNAPRIRLETNKSSVMRRFGIRILCIHTTQNIEMLYPVRNGARRLVRLQRHSFGCHLSSFLLFCWWIHITLASPKKKLSRPTQTHTLAPTSKSIETSAISNDGPTKLKQKREQINLFDIMSSRSLQMPKQLRTPGVFVCGSALASTITQVWEINLWSKTI